MPSRSSVSLSSHQPPLDTRYQVETPEGIDLHLRPAGLVPRALAFAIDLAIRGLILAVTFIVLGLLGQFGMGLGTILLFLVTWWYMVLFEVFNQGRSPGKQMLGLRVVHDDGTPIGWAASLTRNLLRFVDILPFGYTLGIISCLNHPAFKRLGDIAAGTLVVYRDADDRVRFSEVTPVTGRLLDLFASETLSGRQAILRLAEELKHPDPGQWIGFGAALLADLRQQGILLGSQP